MPPANLTNDNTVFIICTRLDLNNKNKIQVFLVIITLNMRMSIKIIEKFIHFYFFDDIHFFLDSFQ